MKNKRIKKKWSRSYICLITALLLQMIGPQQSVKAAADVTVHIMQGD